MATPDSDEMISFRVPLARAATSLDRSLFSKTVKLAAATVKDNRNISKYRKQLEKSKELLDLDRLDSCRSDPVNTGLKCLLLRPGVKHDAPTTWGPVFQEGIKSGELDVIPYELQLDYDYWSYLDVMTSILPEELHVEIPVGFNTAGHVAHLNLRDRYLPYKKIIAEVILDKNPKIRTVINKVDNVGDESEFRTFGYEVLSGPDDMNVEVKENDCVFQFDYSKVYWNSKLEPEHTRLIKMFQPGEVVADVMAGIGPFAVPAGKKGVFVFANDMNPESFKYLTAAVEKNKVSQYVRPYNMDGRKFIQEAVHEVYAASTRGDAAIIKPKQSRSKPQNPPPEPKRIPVPPTISHFVMNLPASAYTFVHHYKGIYAGHEKLFEPHTSTKLPMVHVHCFALKSDDEVPLNDILDRVHQELGVRFKLGDADKQGEMTIYDVRDVAPKKRMFCASFRIPPEVAFATGS
ncbi:tRNA (guanine(37)-N1)-methyltransferase [Colletotrichum gloeosporioides]|uniref:tRNA (guanine(37)-N1)-methyltransferase n=2 Tax=Colletotrichum gloeosporioides TaxID=474922 RepID=T0JZ22_COLGC|nr:tRNA (guanine(37)-N1)-methyltransferase [Colletotrichum gloeosporioides]EQB45743.1 Met-10+ like-protein [Colletotrichum gloeosporioides Cg-14]KAF3804774.1 tRNA (guanine(37)-N1)-methyltransferase [Colletotrichum gloeosporioides]KAJ3953374.1 tRNA(m(1)G37)methyltransferase [Colletotrichum tropicale]